MALTSGTRLGPYQTVSLLGAGGMGEVCRARDIRLGRAVAVKVLAPRWAADAEALRRFEREARVISQLSHPNLCTLFDLAAVDDTRFIVMEFLEGQVLKDAIGSRPLDFPAIVQLGSADCVRAGGCSCARDRSPRHQTREHLHHAVGDRQAAGFRTCAVRGTQGGGSRRADHDHHGADNEGRSRLER